MDAGAIEKRIMEDAEADAAEALRELRLKAEGLRADSARRIEASKKDAAARAEKEAGEMADRMGRMAELDERKTLLSVKRGLLDKAFGRALELLEATPPKEARRFFMEQLLRCAEGGETVLPGARGSAWLDEAFVREAREKMAATRGAGTALRLGGERTEGVGFALVKDGARVECTFSSLLAAQRLRLEPDAARELFG